jgi:hypothetical protein
VLHAFFDESGTHKGAKILCVAACFADHVAWDGFKREWRRVLNDAGVSRYHAKERECESLSIFMADLIKKYNINTAVCSATQKLFDEHAGKHFRTTIGNPYSTCAYGCALNIARHAKKKVLGPVAMVLEWGQPNVDKVKKTLEELIGDHEYAIASVAVVRKEEFIQLHVPDFISHICSTHDPWYKVLVDSGGIVHAHLNEKVLKNTSRDVTSLIEKNRAEKRRVARLDKSTHC